MNILIVEDDEIQRKSLKVIIQQIDENINIYEAEDKDEALEIANNDNIDMFYIDISLKNSSGFDLAIGLRRIHRYELTPIIFLTTHVQYIVQALQQVHCYNYIIKPYKKDDVVNMTKLFLSHDGTRNDVQKDKKYVVFEIKKGIKVKIYVAEIIFIETNLRICIIHTVNGVYKINRLALDKIIKFINYENIIQCHKSFAVNIDYIRKIETVDSKLSEIYFENYDEKIPLGYKFKNTMMDRFQ